MKKGILFGGTINGYGTIDPETQAVFLRINPFNCQTVVMSVYLLLHSLRDSNVRLAPSVYSDDLCYAEDGTTVGFETTYDVNTRDGFGTITGLANTVVALAHHNLRDSYEVITEVPEMSALNFELDDVSKVINYLLENGLCDDGALAVQVVSNRARLSGDALQKIADLADNRAGYVQDFYQNSGFMKERLRLLYSLMRERKVECRTLAKLTAPEENESTDVPF